MKSNDDGQMVPDDRLAQQLSRGVSRGSESAFETFYSVYGDRLFRYLLVLARGDEEAAKDVHQEAMVRIVRYLQPMETEEHLWRWSVRVIRSCWLDRCRRCRRRIQTVAIEHEPMPEVETERVLQDQLSVVLERLPDADRRLVEDHYFDGHPQQELARTLGISPAALAMRFMRIRQSLRRMLMEAMRNV